MKNKFLTSIFLAVLILVSMFQIAFADDNYNSIAIFPGTSGINWTVPYKAKDIFISERYGTNWTEISMFNTIQGGTLNWSNPYRIQAGSNWHLTDTWSSGNVIAIRGQNASQEVDIVYTVSN